MADKNPPPPDLNSIKNAIIGDPSGRKSRVATAPLDPSGDTYMGASVGAKPTISAEVPAAAPSGMEQMAAAAAKLVGGDSMAARRRNRQPRQAVDIDPTKLAEFTQSQATSEVVQEVATANPPAAVEKPSVISNLMAPSPEPSPEKAAPGITKESTPPPVAKVQSPKQPSPKPVESKVPSLKPIEAPEPKKPPAAILNTPIQEPPKMDDATKQKLDIYDKICQKLVKDKDPSPQALIGFLEPILKQELPDLQEKVKTCEKKLSEMIEQLAERDSTIASLRLKVAEAEKNAASVVAGSTSNALETAAINDEDVNRLRGAFEDHMLNYQKSMDQFQLFFDKITQDLENTFTELGIEDNTNEAAQK